MKNWFFFLFLYVTASWKTNHRISLASWNNPKIMLLYLYFCHSLVVWRSLSTSLSRSLSMSACVVVPLSYVRSWWADKRAHTTTPHTHFHSCAIYRIRAASCAVTPYEVLEFGHDYNHFAAWQRTSLDIFPWINLLSALVCLSFSFFLRCCCCLFACFFIIPFSFILDFPLS